MRSRVISICLLVFILAVIFFSPAVSYLFKDFIVSRLEKVLDMNIVLGITQFKLPTKITIADVKVIGKYGPAFVAERADFQLDVSEIIRARIVLNCNFQNVGLKSSLSNMLNEILKPLAVSPQDIYNFDDAKGIITIKKGVFAINDLNAVGPDFKFSGDFMRFNSKRIDYDIEFNINERVLTSDKNQRSPFFIDEDADGWYSVVLSVKGDPHKPSNIFFSTGGINLQVQPHGQ